MLVQGNITEAYLELMTKQIFSCWELPIAAKQTSILLGMRLRRRE
jgi:hypothetical protein